jgi:hypothetical protein
MTVADDVIRSLRGQPAGLTDAELAAALGKGRRHINKTCHVMADQWLTTREDILRGIVNKAAGQKSHPVATSRPAKRTDQDWAWEGNVQSRLVTHLVAHGWSIVQVADTARQERGIDIDAKRDGQRLLIEVKGWPSTTYARGERAGQLKPARPNTQATHWFAEAFTTLIRRGAEPDTRLAIGLPDMPRYRALLGEAAWALQPLDITVYLVTADGTVHTWEAES